MNDEARDLVSVGDASFVFRGDHLDVQTAITNTSDRPLYVGSGVRQIRYDADARALDLWTSDHGPDDDEPGSRRHMTTPATVIISPGETYIITIRTPRALIRIFDDGTGRPDFEHIDLSGASRVTLHGFVAERPFYPIADSAAPSQTRDWGTPFTIEARLVKDATSE